MKIHLNFLILAVFFSFTVSVFGQIPQPSPQPIEVDDDVVKITTTLIQMDVVVTDSKGNQITGLKPEDFEIYENGKKQDITNLSYISSKQGDSSTNNQNVNGKIGIPIPSKNLAPEQVRRTYALVVDDLGLSAGNVWWVKKALEKFINEQMQQGDLVAIVRTGGGFGAIQPFTSDKNQLLASIQRLKWNPSGRVGIDSFEAIKRDFKSDLTRENADGSIHIVPGIKEDLEFQEEIESIRKDNFAAGTIGSLSYIIRGMQDMPGRKSVMLFSEGFVLLNKSTPNSNTFSSTRVLEAMKVLADTANRASVAIYTLDPRGLENPLLFTAEDELPTSSLLDERGRKFRSSQQSLQFLAEETGGFAYINQNDLNYGLRKAIDDQSYYLIGYEPDSETFDPKKNRFNNIKIKVNRSEANVRYRSGFFAIADKDVETQPQTPEEKVRQAILSPFGTNEIDLRLYTITGNDPKNGDFIRTLVNISAKDLEFTNEPDGTKKASFDIIALTFGIDGNPVDQVMRNYTIKVNEKTYQQILARGFVYDLPVNLEKSGAYQFRLALRDSKSGKVGSTSKFIEVPKFKKNKLWVSNLMVESNPVEKTNGASQETDINRALTDTTLREFTSPVVLRYGAVIYNANANGGAPKLSVQTRFISNGKIILENPAQPVPIGNQTDFRRINLVGAFTLENNFPPGEYIFQVIVADESSGKRQVATQWIDFETIK